MNPNIISIISPTRNRSKAFTLCEKYIARQTYKGDVQWVVVNDGEERYQYHHNQTVILRDKSKDDPAHHSITYNYLAGLEAVKGDRILCIEDDDFYRSNYLETMVDALDSAPLVGGAPALYFHITSRRWQNMKNDEHCSLAATGFTSAVFDTFAQACTKKTPYIDLWLWSHWTKTLQLPFNIVANDFKRPLHVGIKGLPLSWGSRGIGLGHCDKSGIRDHLQLRRWIGADAKAYDNRL